MDGFTTLKSTPFTGGFYPLKAKTGTQAPPKMI
jgi:hypothetical protein